MSREHEPTWVDAGPHSDDIAYRICKKCGADLGLPENTTLLQRLKEIMPKKPKKPWDGKSLMQFEHHPIRQSADAFTGWIGKDMPKTTEELNAVLWVFGEILSGDMEKRYNYAMKGWTDAINLIPGPAWVFPADSVMPGMVKEANASDNSSYS